MSELEIRHLHVVYDDEPVVKDVSLRVPAGGRLAILGPSGSGKSSILRAIAGLVPSRGEVLLAGSSLAGVPTHRRDVGLMFQDNALFTHLNVVDNVGFGLRMRGATRSRARVQAQRFLELVGLEHKREAAVTDLSGGEQQRVALARTLAPGPAVVLLDEPVGALDRALREELLVAMTQVFDELRTTVVMVTHDQSEAFEIGRDVAVMRDGRISVAGAAAQVWANPQDSWTARFLGLNNVMEPGQPLHAALGCVPGVTTLLRPSLSRVADAGDARAARVLTGVVEWSRFRGGLYRAALSELSVGGSPVPGGRVEVWSDRELEQGPAIAFTIADDDLVPLND